MGYQLYKLYKCAFDDVCDATTRDDAQHAICIALVHISGPGGNEIKKEMVKCARRCGTIFYDIERGVAGNAVLETLADKFIRELNELEL